MEEVHLATAHEGRITLPIKFDAAFWIDKCVEYNRSQRELLASSSKLASAPGGGVDLSALNQEHHPVYDESELRTKLKEAFRHTKKFVQVVAHKSATTQQLLSLIK